MRLITLGTSHGSPTATRFNSASVLEVGDSLYLFEAGAPVNALMLRKNLDLDRLKAVFVSHAHEDHIGGLPGLIKSLNKRPETAPCTAIFLPEKQTCDAVTAFVAATHRMWTENVLTMTVIRPGEVYADGHIRVTAWPTAHARNEGKDFPTFAFAVDAEGKRIVFTGDLSRSLEDFPRGAFDRPAVCVMECQHYRPELAGAIFREIPITRFIGVHISNKWDADPAGFVAALGEVPCPVELARDGMEFTL